MRRGSRRRATPQTYRGPAPTISEVAFQRGIDGSEPLRGQPLEAVAGLREKRDATSSWRLGSGTLACPLCDAPVALGGRVVAPAQDLHCPYCLHRAALRDFLSLAVPSRPARVELRLRLGRRGRQRTAGGPLGAAR